MWYLQSMTDADRRFSLVPDREMIVGRKDCDILINWDGSISRKHAQLIVSEGEPGVVSLTDFKSKFGTSVNGKRIGANLKMELRRGDVIAFGQGPTSSRSRFRLVFEPLVFCCSAMSKTESSDVRQLARAMGAEVVSSWSERCSHLIMTGITVTVKVVSALSSCKPVVTPAWVQEASRCLQSSLPLPSPSSFQPEVVDANISQEAHKGDLSFAPNFGRNSLFQDRVFYFLSEKQLTRLQSCLQCAGASCQLISSPDSSPLETLLRDQSVVLAVDSELMKQATPAEQKWIQQVFTFLKSNDLRAVLDSEIGFALLFISAEEYTNPRKSPSMSLSNTPMAPPTLSQAPFSQQPHSSHHHSLTHPHTLPYTQDSLTTTTHAVQDQTTILAPDTIDQSQPPNTSAKLGENSSSVGAERVNDTILSNKGSLGSLDKSSAQIKTEVTASKTSQDKSSLIAVNKSSECKDKHPPPSSSGIGEARSAATKTVSVKEEEALDSLFGGGDCSAGPLVMDDGAQDCLPQGDGKEREGEGGADESRKKESDDERESSSERARLKLKKSPRQAIYHSQETKPAAEKPTHEKTHKEDGGQHHSASAGSGDHGLRGACAPTEPESVISEPPQATLSSNKSRAASSVMTQDDKEAKRDLKSQRKGGSQTSSTLPDDQGSISKPAVSPSPDITLPSPTQLEGSVIVPCSLTPRTQDKAKKPNPLPDSQTLAFAFQGRRKKRSHREVCDSTSEAVVVVENQSKKKRVNDVVEKGGGGRGEKKEGDQLEKQEREAKKEEKKEDDNSVVSGLKRKQMDSKGGKRSDAPCAKKVRALPPFMAGLPLLETHKEVACDSAKQQPPSQDTLDYSADVSTEKKRVKAKETAMEVEVKISGGQSGTNVASQAPLPPCTQPRVPPSSPDPSLFLSTRKKRRKSPRDNPMAALTTPDKTSSKAMSPYTQYTSTTQTAYQTQRSGVCVATPFTTLVTGGRRTKASDRDNTNTLWEDGADKEQLDGEDPLVNEFNEDVSMKIYKPVFDGEGFICSRMKPRIQTSRVGRLAAFADSQHSHTSDQPDSGGSGGGRGNGLPEPVAEIVFAKLVVVSEERGGRVRRGREVTEERGGRAANGVNFKKFIKVQHIGQGAIPRLVSLRDYVPPTSRELQDWMEEMENATEVGQDQEPSSQDLFRFTNPTASSGGAGSRRHHRT